MSVVLVPFLSLALLKHAISRYTWLSAGLAAAGLYLLTFTGSALSLNKGDGLILLCAVAFALQIVYTGIYALRYPSLPLAALQLGFWIQTACQKYTTPSRVAIIYATEPVFAAATGLLFDGETLGLSAVLGCGCILAAMLLAELSPAPEAAGAES